MAATSQIMLAQISARVPQTQDGWWRIMLDLDRDQGAFTVRDVDRETNTSRFSIEHYVKRLLRGGFLSIVGERVIPGCPAKAKVYRLVRRPAAAPRLRDDGTPVPPSAQERLWRGMRTLRQFDARELAFAAGVEGHEVPTKTAQRYINQLALAGYLAVIAGRTGRACVYRLKPSMNTGPKPPSVLKIEAVWDRNLNKLFARSPVEAVEVHA